ncbi:MAG: type II toxin-antitoxin system PemK/MazF family toxin [Euryarchaeota archaeon]|nr:type II toxin-antitoxin system PemK/MazF family toxin [Euryarchaeota archaeon]
MQSGHGLKAGDIVLVPFPYTDQTARKTRPAMVLSDVTYNRKGRDVIVLGMTSNLENSSHSVLVQGPDLASGSLIAPTRVKADKVLTIHQSLVRKQVGTIKPTILDQVLKEFLALLPN